MAKKEKKDIPVIVQKQASADGKGTKPVSRKQFSLSGFRIQALMLVIIVLVFYGNTFQHEAAFDDRMAISDNEYVQRGVAGIPDILTKDAFQSYLESKQANNQLAGGRYRPLSLITFAVEQQMMGVAPDSETANDKEIRVAHDMHMRHVVNVLLYILSIVVLLYFLRSIVFPGRELLAFIAVLLFTIHPIHSEVVANVKSRDEILSLLFIVLTFITALRYRDTRKTKDLLLSLLCFFLALLSKEYSVTLILLLPLSFYLFRQESVLRSIKSSLTYLVPLVIYFLLRFSAVTAMAAGAEKNILNNPYLYASDAECIATKILILLDYLRLLIFPSVLSADYSYNAIPYVSFSNPMVWVSIVVHIGLLAVMFLLLQRRHVIGFAIAFYFANLLLVSNLFINIGAPMGERLIYHSSFGFSIATAYILYTAFGKIKQNRVANAGLAGLMALLIVLCGLKTIDRNKDWKNDTVLFMKDVSTVPNSVLVNNNAAAACMALAKQTTDKTERKEWFEKAVGYFDKAILLYPHHLNARMNRGLSYFDMGQPGKALPDWDTVRKYEPSNKKLMYYFSVLGKYYYNEGLRYANTGKPDSAIAAFKNGTDAAPDFADMWRQLGNAYIAAGNQEQGINAYKKADLLKTNGYK